MKPLLSMAVESLMRLGEYKLAFRLIFMEFRIQKMRRAKEKHNRKHKELTKKVNELHREIAAINFFK